MARPHGTYYPSFITLFPLPILVATDPKEHIGNHTGEEVPIGAELFPVHDDRRMMFFDVDEGDQFAEQVVAWYRPNDGEAYRLVAVDIRLYRSDDFGRRLNEAHDAVELRRIVASDTEAMEAYQWTPVGSHAVPESATPRALAILKVMTRRLESMIRAAEARDHLRRRYGGTYSGRD